jgi:hypothetical protein
LTWSPVPEGEVAVGLLRWRRRDGNSENRWYFLFRRFGEEQIYYQPVFSQTIITATPGSNQTITSDATWSNSSNSVELIGGGGSGSSAAQGNRGAGGGGAYTKIVNFIFATPGTTTATLQVGAGGAAVTGATAGNPGGDSWFNSTAYPTSGAGAGAKGGAAGSAATAAGGAAASAYTNPSAGAVTFSGGTGNGAAGATGGGGAAGPAGNGGNGSTTQGGNANNNTTAGPTVQGPGNSGTEFDGTHGCGTGGFSSAGSAATDTGGLYGGAGAGGAATGACGVGAQGLAVLNWTPGAAGQMMYAKRRFNIWRH